MKKIISSLIIAILLVVNANAVEYVDWSACKIRDIKTLNNRGCHYSSDVWPHCHEKEFKEQIQEKVDVINSRLEKMYLKNPESVKRLSEKFEAFSYNLKPGTYVYLLVEGVTAKMDELLEREIKTEEDLKSEKNTFNDSYSKAKKYLEGSVYNEEILKQNTFYCGCDYSTDKFVDKESCGFEDNWKYVSRSKKIEWEHVVPAHAFWQSFVEWREGDEKCVDSKGKLFSWRNCAWKVNMEYRYMESDMYNLVPSIWSINALRSNYSFAMIEGENREFWTCNMEIKDRKAEPKEEIQWDIARIYMYMDITYPGRWVISSKNEKLFEIWNKNDPVSEKECTRYKKIKEIQGNENIILKEKCK